MSGPRLQSPPAHGEHSLTTLKSKFICVLMSLPSLNQNKNMNLLLPSQSFCLTVTVSFLFKIIAYRRMPEDTFPLVVSKVGTTHNKYQHLLKQWTHCFILDPQKNRHPGQRIGNSISRNRSWEWEERNSRGKATLTVA